MQSNTTEETNHASNTSAKFSGLWPYRFNSAFACLGCTIGIFNIDRFSTHSIHYGANFIIQFLIMSVIFGIPLFTLQLCLGEKLKSGVLHIWKISPLFQGVGIALLIAQTYIGIYNIVGVSWLLVYLRDSFISIHEAYPWTKDFMLNRNEFNVGINSTQMKVTELTFTSLNQAILYKQDLNQQNLSATMLRFQIAFNLAVIWIMVFFSLCKGLHSYGKVVYYYVLISVLCNLLFCIKVFNLIPRESSNNVYSTHAWSDLFLNYKSWIAATSEAFLTWGLLGASAMQIAVHNRNKSFVKRDILFVVTVTLLVLFLNVIVGNTCVKVLNIHGYNFMNRDDEKINFNVMHVMHNPKHKSAFISTNISSTLFIPESILQSDADSIKKYGYNILSYSTKLVPFTIALLGNQNFIAIWAIFFYLALILIGLSQQLAIWNCVIMGILSINTKENKSLKTRLVFLSCLCGFCLGLPMATELGSYTVYYLEYIISKSWWVIILYLIQCGVVFLVRRGTYKVILTTDIFPSTNKYFQHCKSYILSILWNITLPTVLLILSVITFKVNGFGESYLNHKIYKSYWAVWIKQIGIIIQLVPLLIVPGVAIIQTCRYLCSGPPNNLQRLQLLCRPPLDVDNHHDVQECENNVTSNIRENEGYQSTTVLIIEDSPPKYTPPPSYSTATGERMARFLRRSFRKSVRSIGKIFSETSNLSAKSTLTSSVPENKY